MTKTYKQKGTGMIAIKENDLYFIGMNFGLRAYATISAIEKSNDRELQEDKQDWRDYYDKILKCIPLPERMVVKQLMQKMLSSHGKLHQESMPKITEQDLKEIESKAETDIERYELLINLLKDRDLLD